MVEEIIDLIIESGFWKVIMCEKKRYQIESKKGQKYRFLFLRL